MTPLDEAFKAAQENQEKVSEFYGRFLNTEVFVPILATPEMQEGRRRSAGEEAMTTLVYTHEGKSFIPVFDSLERFQAWVTEPAAYMALQAHAFIAGCHGKASVVLNPGTEYAKEFIPDEIHWLQEVIRGQSPQEQPLSAGSKIWLGVPENTSPALLEQLRQTLARNKEVKAAYLVRAIYGDPNSRPRLLLLIQADTHSPTSLQSIFEDIGMAIKGMMGEEQTLDIIPYMDGSSIDGEIIRIVEPFYRG